MDASEPRGSAHDPGELDRFAADLLRRLPKRFTEATVRLLAQHELDAGLTTHGHLQDVVQGWEAAGYVVREGTTPSIGGIRYVRWNKA